MHNLKKVNNRKSLKNYDKISIGEDLINIITYSYVLEIRGSNKDINNYV